MASSSSSASEMKIHDDQWFSLLIELNPILPYEIVVNWQQKSPSDEFEHLKAIAVQSGIEVDDEELFLQAVGGKNKKGTVYKLRTESEAYYPRFAHRSASSSSYTPSIVSQMEARLKKIKGGTSSYGEELRATREEQKQQRELIASLLSCRIRSNAKIPRRPLDFRLRKK
ncbi:hypothetical protein Cgig2_030959 [Carnegiea gigantea]|uniref:Uncharacterized protein n=1 Tax=Carnegiea gigantea TaxID=171969 RepID=A0A9Q1K4F0_9CARY|nr:hypothetical protein Cgig2_030959 [Carnegiea gigantea]